MPYRDPVTQRDYQRDWMRARRLAFMAGRRCENCHSCDELELHHIDQGTKVSHRIWSWTEERRAAELAKCEVLCRPCHEAIHWPGPNKRERARQIREGGAAWLAEWDRRREERRTRRRAKRGRTAAP